MKVGDYIRTIKGFGKVEKIEILKKDTIIYLDSGITIDYITKDFTKDELNKMYPSSSNIIDLIEAGDYVNGEEVVGLNEIQYIEDEKPRRIALTLAKTVSCLPEDIKTIVTKEQFASMEYKVGE